MQQAVLVVPLWWCARGSCIPAQEVSAVMGTLGLACLVMSGFVLRVQGLFRHHGLRHGHQHVKRASTSLRRYRRTDHPGGESSRVSMAMIARPMT